MAWEYNEKSKQTMLKYQRTLKQISLKMKEDVYNDINQYAESIDMPVRQLILVAIKEYRENHPVSSLKGE